PTVGHGLAVTAVHWFRHHRHGHERSIRHHLFCTLAYPGRRDYRRRRNATLFGWQPARGISGGSPTARGHCWPELCGGRDHLDCDNPLPRARRRKPHARQHVGTFGVIGRILGGRSTGRLHHLSLLIAPTGSEFTTHDDGARSRFRTRLADRGG